MNLFLEILAEELFKRPVERHHLRRAQLSMQLQTIIDYADLVGQLQS